MSKKSTILAPSLDRPLSPSASLLEAWRDLGGRADALRPQRVTGEGAWPSCFDVTGMAVDSWALVGQALAQWMQAHGVSPDEVVVDQRLASRWFASSCEPQGWTMPPLWDAVAGDYPCADGWVRLHTNAEAHRRAALAVLREPAERDAVARAVRDWSADELAEAVTAAGGCAAAMRSALDWSAHPQGRAVLREPLLDAQALHGPSRSAPAVPRREGFDGRAPLRGVRVLDLTRILAGPTATRCLAGWGAQVLRLDPPGWEEPAVAPDVLLGKRSARLDLATDEGRQTFEGLLSQADVLVHGLRPGALDGLGWSQARLRAVRPDLVEVCLCAYGWTGPWAGRRGFDSLVQMACGIADAGMHAFGRGQPTPLPVQALDMAAGYLMAAAAVRGLTVRHETGAGWRARCSLARTAEWLRQRPAPPAGAAWQPDHPQDWQPEPEVTSWGPVRRLRAPLQVGAARMHWALPARAMGWAEPVWAA